ncbi:SDR family oxidoreductase [Bowmanella yangjiangensis]|uniref:SDR family oxidoreductase n=1 Tax=Bowmanella yangjiangensis TaxID=2811230 RepID=A0ABS3CQM9_9ALTE|nr:SDR family oxidoreductase [Bowmanella yangjiangensis]MBN7818605.1 SDR family oxidoreductase [Bowmanella yangjiangensis]
MNWSTQLCLLTGASGGIGQAIARTLAEAGVQLILQGRNAQALQTLADSLPGTHQIVVADISSSQGRDELLKELARFPNISMLINNAGIAPFGELQSMSDEDLEQTIQTNLLAPMALIRALLPTMKKHSEAYIVNVGSTFGSIGFACNSLYCASKFGLRGFTEALQRELAGSSVKVFYLAPRATQTAINSDDVVAMNKALGNQVDSPELVAQALKTQLQQGERRKFIGFPEKLFVRINGAFPALVDNALVKKLPIIKKFAAQHAKEILV